MNLWSVSFAHFFLSVHTCNSCELETNFFSIMLNYKSIMTADDQALSYSHETIALVISSLLLQLFRFHLFMFTS